DPRALQPSVEAEAGEPLADHPADELGHDPPEDQDDQERGESRYESHDGGPRRRQALTDVHVASPPMGPRPYPGVVPRTLGETETDRFSPRRLPVIDQAESSEGDHWSLTVSDAGVGDAGGGGTVPRDRRRGGGTRGGPRDPP